MFYHFWIERNAHISNAGVRQRYCAKERSIENVKRIIM